VGERLGYAFDVIPQRQHAPWYNDQILAAKRMTRKAERKWHSANSMYDLNVYKSARNSTTNLIKKVRFDFIKTSFKKTVWIKEISLGSQSSCYIKALMFHTLLTLINRCWQTDG